MTEQEERQNNYARLKELKDKINAALAEAEAFAVEKKLSFSIDLDYRSMSFVTDADSAPNYMDAPCWVSSSDYC